MASKQTKAKLVELLKREYDEKIAVTHDLKTAQELDIVRCETIVKQGEQIQAMQLQHNKLCADLRDLEWDRDNLCQVVGELSLKLKRDRSVRFDGERR